MTENPLLKYFLAFNQIDCLGPIEFKNIVDGFSAIDRAWTASTTELKKIGLPEKIANQIESARQHISPDNELEKIKKEEIKVCLLTDRDYPLLLKEIYDPPVVLYYRGSLEIFNQPTLAVVGARKFTAYGRQVAEHIVPNLVRQGLGIVSGLALGIDGLAHEACLSAGGLTAAILGSGVDRQSVYPSTHRYLAQKTINSGGCVISEFPLGSPPLQYHFPRRNRIISGLSLGTLVIEAKEKSGSLITARTSQEQNREVFAIPGNIYNENSRGCNELIKSGAKLVNCFEDVLIELGIQPAMPNHQLALPAITDPNDQTVLSLLSQEPLHIDKLPVLSKLDISVVLSSLTSLEISGAVKNLGGGNFVRNI